ncbi:hypothetical protein VS884_25760, partial [Escherichia coli]
VRPSLSSPITALSVDDGPLIFMVPDSHTLLAAAAVSVWWLGMALRGYKVADDRIWAPQAVRPSLSSPITALSVDDGPLIFMVPDSHTLLAA